MGMDAGICRQMLRGRCLIRAPEFLCLDDAVGDAEAAGVGPADFPESLRGAPDGAEAPGALAQIGLVPGNAHCDDVVIPPPRAARARLPRDGLDDQLHRFQAPTGFGIVEVADTHQAFSVALDELSGPFVSRTQREPCLHASVTGHCAWR